MIQTPIGWITQPTETYEDAASFPTEWIGWIYYLDQDTDKLYRWNGTIYIEVSRDEQDASQVPFDNTASQLLSENVQAALLELEEWTPISKFDVELWEDLTALKLVSLINDWWVKAIDAYVDTRLWETATIAAWAHWVLLAEQVDSTRVFIQYDSKAVIATVIDWVITYWTPVDLWGTVGEASLTLNWNFMFMSYTDYADQGLWIIYEIVFTDLVPWTPVAYATGWLMKWNRSWLIWEWKFAVAFSDWSTWFNAKVVIWTSIWTALTWWTPVAYLTSEAYSPCISYLGPDKAFLVYQDQDAGWAGTWRVISASGTVPTLETAAQFVPFSVEQTWCVTIWPDKVLITFLSFGNNQYCDWVIANMAWTWH